MPDNGEESKARRHRISGAIVIWAVSYRARLLQRVAPGGLEVLQSAWETNIASSSALRVQHTSQSCSTDPGTSEVDS